jgi:hypothetical protein
MRQPENDVHKVLHQLSILEPGADDTPRPAGQALASIRQQIEQRQQNRFPGRLARLLSGANRRFALAAAFSVLLLLFGLSFSFPTMRAAASDFLGLFRVQKFAAISISPEQIAFLERMADEGLTPGEFEVTQDPGAPSPVSSLSEASAMTGLAVRSLTQLGDPEVIYVNGGSEGRLTIDLAGSRAILAASGVDPSMLPDSLDGQQVTVTIFAGVEQHWQDGTWLLQTESPLVEYPHGLDPVLMGQALLQILGMNKDEALRLARNIDWTSTLLLPVPQDLASFNEVQVDGQSSLALTSLDGQHGVILWQNEGIIFLLNGSGSLAELASLANSLP